MSEIYLPHLSRSIKVTLLFIPKQRNYPFGADMEEVQASRKWFLAGSGKGAVNMTHYANKFLRLKVHIFEQLQTAFHEAYW